MKPSSFAYHRPETLGEALTLLAELGSDAKILAGGQSLVPILNMRLAAPANLVDINHIDELGFVRVEGGGVLVGATARHSDLEHHDAAYDVAPILRRAVRNVAHPTIRNRGTTVGSLVHADPSGEMPSVLALLGGSVTLATSQGARVVPAADFFTGPLESCLEPGELATSAFFPAPARRHGSSFVELSRRHGDYAMCGVAAQVLIDDDLRIEQATASYISVSATPLVVDLTDAVAGATVDTADWSAAGRLARSAAEPEEDIHATAEFRRHLVGTLTEQALHEAVLDATARAMEKR